MAIVFEVSLSKVVAALQYKKEVHLVQEAVFSVNIGYESSDW